MLDKPFKNNTLFLYSINHCQTIVNLLSSMTNITAVDSIRNLTITDLFSFSSIRKNLHKK